MKHLLIIVCALAITPILSSARAGRTVKPYSKAPSAVRGLTETAIRVPLKVTEHCGAGCATAAGKLLTPAAVRTANRAGGETVGKVLKTLPGATIHMNPNEIASATSSLIAAAAQAKTRNWPQEQHNNVIAFALSLEKDGLTPANAKRLAEVKEKCR